MSSQLGSFATMESFVGVDQYAGRGSSAALEIQRMLQNYNGCHLVNYLARGPGVSPGCPERTLRRDGGETLVHEANVELRSGVELRGESCRIRGGCGVRAGKGERQPDHDLHGVLLPREPQYFGEVPLAASNRSDRSCEHAVEVAPGHPDARFADVDADPHARPHG